VSKRIKKRDKRCFLKEGLMLVDDKDEDLLLPVPGKDSKGNQEPAIAENLRGESDIVH
jgi:hypothetical protein